MEKTPLLFTPYVLGTATLRNRIVVSPMCQYSCEDGFANDWHLVHLGSRAVGGAGMVVMEATAVSAEGRISPGDMGLWKDDHIEPLQRITRFLKSQGAVAGIQLAHSGRKAGTTPPWEGIKQIPEENGGWQGIAPSAIPYREHERAPVEATVTDIRKVINDFKSAARRAQKAGFDVIEIHAAHGYLLHSFLSPLSNRRTDDYGGAFENRSRLLMEVINAVRQEWPKPHALMVRISATDYADGGWQPEDSVKLAVQLQHAGVDLVDCSSGGNVPNAPVPVGPGYQVPFAAAVKAAGVPAGAVGLITHFKQAEEILQAGAADLIFMAREFLRDPYFPLHAAMEAGLDVPWPKQYERAAIKKR